MRCMRCHSFRIVRFIDGFGQRRIFCRDCQESFLDRSFFPKTQTRLWEFRPATVRLLSAKTSLVY